MTPGLLIGKQYRLTRQLGSGAMGVVWAAVNEKTGREVALKLILHSTEELRHRLQREARACGALQHRNIVDIYDVGQTDEGDPFLVMQLLTGETLADRLARQRRIDPLEAALIGRDVARALEAAHGASIIHRDLKPANIFLHREAGSEGAVVKVLDFGVSKNLAASDGLSTVVGGMVGSPAYMSPEQARSDRSVDHRTDIWSLGVVLFETLTGVRPFQGDSTQILKNIGTGEIPLVSRYVRRIDDGLVQLVARCLERDVKRRIATAKELAERLDRYTSSGPARSAPAASTDVAASAPRVEPNSALVPPLAADPAPRPVMPSGVSLDSATRSPRLPGMQAAPVMPTSDMNEPDAATAKLDPMRLAAIARSGPTFGSSPRHSVVEALSLTSDVASGDAPLRAVPMPSTPGTVPLASPSDPGASRMAASVAMPATPSFGAPELPTQPLHGPAPAPAFGAASQGRGDMKVTERLSPQSGSYQAVVASQHAGVTPAPQAARSPMQSQYDVNDPHVSVTKGGTVRINPDVVKHLPPPGAPPPAPPPPSGLSPTSSTAPLLRSPTLDPAIPNGNEPIALPVQRTGLYVALGIAAVAAIALGVGGMLMFGKTSAAPVPTTGATASATPSASAAPTAGATVSAQTPADAGPTPPPTSPVQDKETRPDGAEADAGAPEPPPTTKPGTTSTPTAGGKAPAPPKPPVKTGSPDANLPPWLRKESGKPGKFNPAKP